MTPLPQAPLDFRWDDFKVNFKPTSVQQRPQNASALFEYYNSAIQAADVRNGEAHKKARAQAGLGTYAGRPSAGTEPFGTAYHRNADAN